ncbi:HlyD family secretion protein [Caballeronia sp. LZ001]|uniref:HlyD family secretion protein n=1 Tax=Caballeronia sp. LZ001 TaxID=3038553 RepID=UPI00285A120C|nr:HlyD family secretion protein [Caballeronia sp. LZ001]MDR5800111.1 HlyD family secretion protein [Caballeronia sp. LZ001]
MAGSESEDSKPSGDAGEGDREQADKKPGEETSKPMGPKRKRMNAIIGGTVLLICVAGGVAYWLHRRHYESTDDAFIDSNQSQIASQVNGRVIELLVADNQHVEKNQPLLRIDPRDFEVKLEQAEAQEANAVAQVAQAHADLLYQQANLAQQTAQVRVAQADLLQAQQDLARYTGTDPAAITRQQLEQSQATTKSALARLDSAKQAVQAGEAQVASQRTKIDAAQASVRQTHADVDNAKLQLSYTEVVAPQAGKVTRRTVNLGNYVTPGQALVAVVPDEMWVTANFKETQLVHMNVGQPVDVTVDAYPDKVLHAHVESLQRGTGSVFSSLPAENATGNYVKVVQRLPVKIVFDGDDWRNMPLAPGLSVSPRVTVR